MAEISKIMYTENFTEPRILRNPKEDKQKENHRKSYHNQIV